MVAVAASQLLHIHNIIFFLFRCDAAAALFLMEVNKSAAQTKSLRL